MTYNTNHSWYYYCIHQCSYPHNTVNEPHEVYMTFIFTHLWSLRLPHKYSRTPIWSTYLWLEIFHHQQTCQHTWLKLWSYDVCPPINSRLLIQTCHHSSWSSMLATTLVVIHTRHPYLLRCHSLHRQPTLVKTIYKGINVHSTGDQQVGIPPAKQYFLYANCTSYQFP